MNLSPNFTLAEMSRSAGATRRGLDNTPPPAAVAALRLLCAELLEPIRAHFDRPVAITSGYRSPAVNKAVGGSASSQHCLGEAADFTVPGVSNLALCQWIQRNLKFDQLIYEFGEAGWVHASWRSTCLRGECLSARKQGGKTVYLKGLIA